jgi:hypothetical protein
MAVYRAQPEQMPTVASGGTALPPVQIDLLEIHLLFLRKVLLGVVTLRFLVRHFTKVLR